MFHIWYTIWYGVTYPDVCCTSLCYRCTVSFALINTFMLCQTLSSVWSDTFMLSSCTLKYSAHFMSRGPAIFNFINWTDSSIFLVSQLIVLILIQWTLSMFMLDNLMYSLFHTFLPFLTFKHYISSSLGHIVPQPAILLMHNSSVFFAVPIKTHSILFSTPINPFLSLFFLSPSKHILFCSARQLIPFSVPSLSFV